MALSICTPDGSVLINNRHVSIQIYISVLIHPTPFFTTNPCRSLREGGKWAYTIPSKRLHTQRGDTKDITCQQHSPHMLQQQEVQWNELCAHTTSDIRLYRQKHRWQSLTQKQEQYLASRVFIYKADRDVGWKEVLTVLASHTVHTFSANSGCSSTSILALTASYTATGRSADGNTRLSVGARLHSPKMSASTSSEIIKYRSTYRFAGYGLMYIHN